MVTYSPPVLMSRTPKALVDVAERIISQPSSPYHTPGLVVSWARNGDPIQSYALGTDAAGATLTPDTPFVLASASKLALGLAVLDLVDAGELDLDYPLGIYLPQAHAASHPMVTIRRLLSHTAGLPLEAPESAMPYGRHLAPDVVRRAVLHTPITTRPGTVVQYSNVGYGVLSLVVEHVTERPVRLALNEVFDRHSVAAFVGEDAPWHTAAVVGVDSPHEGTALAPYGPFWRSLALPWANITTTSEGLLRLVLAYRERPDATRSQTGDLGGGFGQPLPFLGFNPSRVITWEQADWGLCVELKGGKKPHWTPPLAAPDSYGHLGSSGVMAWCDPPSGCAWSICGCKTTDTGWLARYGPAIGGAILSKG